MIADCNNANCQTMARELDASSKTPTCPKKSPPNRKRNTEIADAEDYQPNVSNPRDLELPEPSTSNENRFEDEEDNFEDGENGEVSFEISTSLDHPDPVDDQENIRKKTMCKYCRRKFLDIDRHQQSETNSCYRNRNNIKCSSRANKKCRIIKYVTHCQLKRYYK